MYLGSSSQFQLNSLPMVWQKILFLRCSILFLMPSLYCSGATIIKMIEPFVYGSQKAESKKNSFTNKQDCAISNPTLLFLSE